MSKKVSDILFYVFAGLFIAIFIACTIFEAIAGTLPTWAAIILCVVEIGLLVAGVFVKNKGILEENNK